MEVYGIIRLKSTHKLEEKIQKDQETFKNLGYGHIGLEVPLIRLLSRTTINGPEYYHKPLLFNYGFIRIPVVLTYSFETLQFLSVVSESISGFILKSKPKLKEELSNLRAGMEQDNPEAKGITNQFRINQCLVETVSPKEVMRLHAITKTLSVYQATDELKIGSYIILRGYPFAGLSGRIEAKHGSHLKVLLLSSQIVVSVTTDNVFYSPYEEETSREICFTDLGYTPEIYSEE